MKNPFGRRALVWASTKDRALGMRALLQLTGEPRCDEKALLLTAALEEAGYVVLPIGGAVGPLAPAARLDHVQAPAAEVVT